MSPPYELIVNKKKPLQNCRSPDNTLPGNLIMQSAVLICGKYLSLTWSTPVIYKKTNSCLTFFLQVPLPSSCLQLTRKSMERSICRPAFEVHMEMEIAKALQSTGYHPFPIHVCHPIFYPFHQCMAKKVEGYVV